MRGSVLDEMGDLDGAFDEYLASLKMHLENIQNGDEILFMDDVLYSWGRLKKALTYLKKLPEKLEGNERLLEKYTRYIKESKPKEKEFKSVMIEPEKPYTNIKHLSKIIRDSDDFLDWFDPYFTTNGFDVLLDSENESVKKIRILSGTKQTNKKLRDKFLRFRGEMLKNGVEVQFRVLIDKSIHDVHDRWLLSKNKKFNLPSLNTIYRGQYSEIKETTNSFPFEKYWEKGKDIVNEWSVIEKYLENNREG